MSKILIVEDDVSFAVEMQGILTREGHKTEVAHSGLDGLQLITNFNFDLVLLDWQLPDITGIEVCKKVRDQSLAVPIVFLTGQVEVSFLEKAFDYGADDYIEKGSDVREILARIRGVLRKKSGDKSTEIKLGEVFLNTKMRYLTIGQSRLELTSTEADLLDYLMRHTGESFSSPELFEAVWDSSSSASHETVRVHINILRKKLALIGHKGFIKTLTSKGYTIDLESL